MSGVIYDLQGPCIYRRYVCTPFAGHALEGRSEIKGFSPSSAARMRRFLRTSDADYSVLITLTYPFTFPCDGRTCKDHLSCFLRSLRLLVPHDPAIAEADQFSAFWFFEFQSRGAPHFHIFTNHRFDKEFIARRWYEIVGSGDSRHLSAGTRIESLRSGRWGTISYATKYAAKREQKEVPENFLHVGRFWGVCGNRKCSAATILFPTDLINTPIHEEFRAALKKILVERRKYVKFRQLGGLTAVINITDTITLLLVRGLFASMEIKMKDHGLGAFFESPLLGGIDDLPVA